MIQSCIKFSLPSLTINSHWERFSCFTGFGPQGKFIMFYLYNNIINPLLTKLVWSRWLDIQASFIFCVFMDLNLISVHKHPKKELGQYPAILTSRLVNNPNLLHNLHGSEQGTPFKNYRHICTQNIVTTHMEHKQINGNFFILDIFGLFHP